MNPSSLALLLADFGEPRTSGEVGEFLSEMLKDQKLLDTPFSLWLHRALFSLVAKVKTEALTKKYALIGGSCLFERTELLAQEVGGRLGLPAFVLHRYLPATHAPLFAHLQPFQALLVFPLFPQFSEATVGGMSHFLSSHLPSSLTKRTKWVPCYAGHPLYVAAMQRALRDFLAQEGLDEQETLLLFSAHGLPQKRVDAGDPYQKECELSFKLIAEGFPKARSLLSYQSRVGFRAWTRPYTSTVCKQVEGKKNGVVVPLSFPSDHIETLYEVEHLYLPLLRQREVRAYRCPALNLRLDWIETIACLCKESLHQIKEQDTYRCASRNRDDPGENDIANHCQIKGAQPSCNPHS